MAYGFSAVLPLQKDDVDGFYVLTKTLAQNIQQNFKNLLLTVPGERVMLPEFGVGLRRFLFEPNSFSLQGEITDKIEEQTRRHMPFVSVDRIDFSEQSSAQSDSVGNILSISIFYSIPSKRISDMISVVGSTA